MKKLFANAIVVCVFFICSSSFAETENEENSGFNPDFFGTLASKGVYSSGISDSYMYNRSDAAGGFKSDYLDLSAYIRRYFNFQKTDGNGAYEYLSFNEAGLSLDAHITETLSLSGDFSRADDFDHLKRDTYYGAVELDFSKIILSADYSLENFEYEMYSNIIKTERRNYSFTFEYNFTDSFSMDAGYRHDNTYFNTLGYDYYRNIFRGGITAIPTDYFFMIAGVSLGKDSEDYSVYGADLGTTFLIYSRFKLFFIYSFNYYNPPQTESSGSGGGGGTGHGAGSTNPYLSSEKIGESYSSNVVTFGASFTF